MDRDFFHVLFITLGYVDMGYESQKYGFFSAAENFFFLSLEDPKGVIESWRQTFHKKSKRTSKRAGFELGTILSVINQLSYFKLFLGVLFKVAY